MILTIIAVVILVTGIVLIVIDRNSNIMEDLLGLGILVTTAGAMASLIVGVVIITSHAAADKSIHEAQIERSAIEKQIEAVNSDYENISRVTVIENVAEWNKKVYDAKYLVENPFVSWFQSKEYVDSLEYIDFEG